MIKIDSNDKKILHELDTNSRQSIQSIGRKVGLHKNVVLHRIKRLEEQNIIKNYFTVIDSSKLGYRSYRLNIQFQNTNDDIINDFINHFVNYKNTWWAVSTKGIYDFSAAIWVKNIKEFQRFWENTQNKYHYYIRKQIFSLYLELFTLRHSYLKLETYDKSDRAIYEIAGGAESIKTDDIDLNILHLMANNSRIPTIELANKLEVSTPTVRKRIRNLINLGVIQGYRINIDYAKMGYDMFKIDLYLNDYTKRRMILDFIVTNPRLIYISKTLGYADIEFDLIVENEAQLHSILEAINKKFPGLINYYNFIHEYKVHKLDYMPIEKN
jgi:Lrp/AsnC family transcriptional regulator, leucine-responsive regulatory protein